MNFQGIWKYSVKGIEFYHNPKFLELDAVNLLYFKHRVFDPAEFIVRNITGLQHQVVKI